MPTNTHTLLVFSKRQYGYRFEKWKIRKYNGVGVNKSITENDLGPDDGDGDDVDPSSFNSTSISILQSLEGSSSSTSTIDPPTPATTSVFDDDDDEDDEVEDDDEHDIEDDDSSIGGSDFYYDPSPSAAGSPLPPSHHSPRHPVEDVKKLAADFSLAVSDDVNAFELFRTLYQAKKTAPPGAEAEAIGPSATSLVLSMARAASRPENVVLARQLLEEHQQLQNVTAQEDMFSLTMMKAYVDERGEMQATPGAIQHIEALIKDALGNNSSSHVHTVTDLIAFQLLDYGSDVLAANSRNQMQATFFNTQNLIKRYVSQQPFDLDLDQGTPASMCIDWCAAQLEQVPQIQIPWRVLQTAADDVAAVHQSWSRHLQLYCTLWKAMLAAVRSDTAPPSWYLHCEEAFGISPSELLVTVCYMIGDETKSGGSSVSTSSGGILTRAKTNARAMMDKSEINILADFLTMFAWMNKLVDNGEQDRGFENIVIPQLREFVSAELGISLPFPPIFFQEHLGGNNIAPIDYLQQYMFLDESDVNPIDNGGDCYIPQNEDPGGPVSEQFGMLNVDKIYHMSLSQMSDDLLLNLT